MKDVKTIVAPWILPREKLPVHLSWKEEKFDEIVLNFPSILSPVDLFNVKNFEQTKDKLIIKELRTNDYFGMNLISLDIPKESLNKIPFSVNFIKKGKIQKEIKLVGTIIRPRLEFIRIPDVLELNNNIDITKLLNIEMKHSGSGNIILSISMSAGGKIISKSENVFRVVWNKLVDGQYIDPDLEKVNVIIDESYIKELFKEFKTMINNEMIPSGLPVESLQTMQKILRESGSEKFMKILTSAIQTYFMESILEIANTYPSDHTTVRGGKTKAFIEGTINSVKIEINYEDTNNNFYETLRKTIKINDNRTNPRPITIPLEITIKPDYIKNLDITNGGN